MSATSNKGMWVQLVRKESVHGSRRAAIRIGFVLAISLVYLLGPVRAAGTKARMAELIAALPFRAQTESVLEHAQIEGYPVNVVRLRTKLPPDRVLDLVRQAWSVALVSSPVIAQNAGWQIVAGKGAGHFQTLQLRAMPGGGTEALLSLWSDPPRWQRSSPVAPSSVAFDLTSLLPADARVLRRLDSADHGSSHQTLVAVASGSPGWVLDALESRLLQLGFSRETLAREQSGMRLARLYREGSRQLGATVHRSGNRSAIVIHLTQANE